MAWHAVAGEVASGLIASARRLRPAISRRTRLVRV